MSGKRCPLFGLALQRLPLALSASGSSGEATQLVDTRVEAQGRPEGAAQRLVPSAPSLGRLSHGW